MSHWESPGKSDEWYTPKWIFDALSCEFDCDVAAPIAGPRYVPVRKWFYFDGEFRPWIGFVWMNPPFGGRNGIRPWLKKFCEHRNGIALTPDRTSAPWFRDFAPRADALRFLPKVKFERPDGTVGKCPSVGTALWASGEKATEILTAADIGWLAKPLPRAS